MLFDNLWIKAFCIFDVFYCRIFSIFNQFCLAIIFSEVLPYWKVCDKYENCKIWFFSIQKFISGKNDNLPFIFCVIIFIILFKRTSRLFCFIACLWYINLCTAVLNKFFWYSLWKRNSWLCIIFLSLCYLSCHFKPLRSV